MHSFSNETKESIRKLEISYLIKEKIPRIYKDTLLVKNINSKCSFTFLNNPFWDNGTGIISHLANLQFIWVKRCLFHIGF